MLKCSARYPTFPLSEARIDTNYDPSIFSSKSLPGKHMLYYPLWFISCPLPSSLTCSKNHILLGKKKFKYNMVFSTINLLWIIFPVLAQKRYLILVRTNVREVWAVPRYERGKRTACWRGEPSPTALTSLALKALLVSAPSSWWERG